MALKGSTEAFSVDINKMYQIALLVISYNYLNIIYVFTNILSIGRFSLSMTKIPT